MSKISKIVNKIIGVSFFVGSSAAFAELPPSSDIDNTFSIAQVGKIMDSVTPDQGHIPLKHENPAIVRIENNYRHTAQVEMAKSISNDMLLNLVQVAPRAAYLQVRF